MNDYKKYDLIIIGGGVAAFSAAIKAESFGIKTAMIERKTLGGTCVSVGCVPSKNLLGFGEIIFSSKKPTYKTIIPCENNFDFFDVITNKDKLVKELRNKKYYDVLSKFENVDLIEGNASFLSNKRIKMKYDKDFQSSEYILEGEKFIIATGSSPNIPNFKDIENIDYLTNVEALSHKKPSSLIVIGGRALGLEFAQMYSRLGTKVTLLQRNKKIIPDHEPEISDNLTKYFVGEGIEIITTVNATNSINEIAVRSVENFNKSLELTQRYYNDIVQNNFNYARKIERSYYR